MTPAERDRLVKFLGMMGSAGDGEVAAAARKAVKLIASLKLTWADVIAIPTTTPCQIHNLVDEAWRAATTGDPVNEGGLDREKQLIALARLRLDEILAKFKDSRKLAHFEAIRAHHRATAYINPSHRAQIDRAWFSSGWDRPVSGTRADTAGMDEIGMPANERLRADMGRYRIKSDEG